MSSEMDVPKHLYVEDLNQEEIDKIEKRMRPNKMSNAGFLGKEESLKDVIKRDTETLERIGISHENIAEVLENYKAFGYGSSSGFLVDEKHKLSVVAWMGWQECPFFYEAIPQGVGYRILNCGSAIRDFAVIDEETKRGIHFSELMPHLVRDHHFFEGKGTSYRLDPLEAVLVLGIQSPKFSKEQLEDMLYKQLSDDLNSKGNEFSHAFATLDWFKDREDFPDKLLELAQKFEGHDNDIGCLVHLVESLPAEKRGELNKAVIGLMDTMDKDSMFYSSMLDRLKKFKREVEGTTHPNLIEGQYWPDYIENSKEYFSDEEVAICVNYVESRKLLFDEVCKRGTPFWNEYLLSKRLGSDRDKTDEEVIASSIDFKKAVGGGSTPIIYMTDDLPYVNGKDNSPEALKKRLEFYEVACDAMALKIIPEELAKALQKRAETLVQLGRKKETKEFAETAVKLYRAIGEREKCVRDYYQKKVDYLNENFLS